MFNWLLSDANHGRDCKRTNGNVAHLRDLLIVSLKGQMMIPSNPACMDHRDVIDGIHKEDYYAITTGRAWCRSSLYNTMLQSL